MNLSAQVLHVISVDISLIKKRILNCIRNIRTMVSAHLCARCVDQLSLTCKHLESTRKGFMMKHVISVQIVIMKAEDSVAFKKHVEYSHAAENTFVISVNSNILC